MKKILLFLTLLFLVGCGTQSGKREVTTLNKKKANVPPNAFLKCSPPVKKPKAIVKLSLTAWQKDRNRLRNCISRNNFKINIIKELNK